MEEDSLRKQHQVIEVPISDPEQVRHHAASGAAPREVVEGLALHAEGAAGVGVVVSQELQHAVHVVSILGPRNDDLLFRRCELVWLVSGQELEGHSCAKSHIQHPRQAGSPQQETPSRGGGARQAKSEEHHALRMQPVKARVWLEAAHQLD